MPLTRFVLLCAAAACSLAPLGFAQADKPPISLDAFFAGTDYTAARIAPDGAAAVVATRMPDWKENRFREDLWLWRADTGKLNQLTTSGHDSGPAWSPDGKFIAFRSDRPLTGEASADTTARLWLISIVGGEARPLYTGKFDLHAYAWAADGSAIYLAIEESLSKAQEQEKEKQWKDVVRWREGERGDVLLRLPVTPAVSGSAAPAPAPHQSTPVTADVKSAEPQLPEGATVVTHTPLGIDSIEPAPDGHALAYITNSISKRLERPEDVEIFVLAKDSASPQQLTHNQALESDLHWSPDSKRLFFAVHNAAGTLEGPYRDVQGRLYTIDPAGGKPERLGSAFDGDWNDIAVLPDGSVLATGHRGTETAVYRIQGNEATPVPGVPGTYGGLEAAHTGSNMLLQHSAINEPTEIYLATAAADLKSAKPLTAFNAAFLNYAQPAWKPYTWKTDDGATIEGVLLYPPGKKNATQLPMLTLIHGGPADADGNRFGADWYDWAALAAARGWLVLRPNYRGSSGYGDSFLAGISPHIVSRPGKDILAGVASLTKAGIADPAHLAIGGYSYGGYMTDWLITQTTQFKAAVTGAGAIENAANWGFDDETYDDAWYLGGRPWENAANYASEAALFQMNKVTTPTHIVGGQADIRVSYFEDVLLERALQSLGVPHAFLAFPGEGHPLAKNPWHGYIKVREELEWLDQYAGPAARTKQ